jgi:hypothetical protein
MAAVLAATPAGLGAQPAPTAGAAAAATAARDSLAGPCVGCPGDRHFALAAGEVVLAELLPYSTNRWLRHEPWERVGLRSWGRNLSHAWEWDTDHFVANQFAHPYSGNLFFNGARSNGYDFWSSAPFALAGSALWECFGETFRPSVNDLVNTTLGGITLGETTYRFACIILDNRSTGGERVWREIGAALVDPMRAFSRLVHGEIGRVGPNPADRLPSRVRGSLALGYQRVDVGPRRTAERGPDQAFTCFDLQYGDPLAGDVAHPFGAFRLDGTAAARGSGLLAQARALGFLAVHDLEQEGRSRQQLALALHYHYYNNRAFENGGQGVSAGLLSRYPIGGRSSLRTELWVTGLVLTALKSDYPADSTALANEDARDYDYGPGAGVRALARFEHGTRWFAELSYEPFWVRIASGVARDHRFRIATARWQIRVWRHLALGQRDLVYYRTGHYAGRATIGVRDLQAQGYAAWVF